MDAASWSRLTRALSFYKYRGYTFVDCLWEAPTDIIDITLGDNSILPSTKPNMAFVGSAEQSFLAKSLSPGKYVGITPCFRPNVEDALHQSYFMKVELFDSAKADYETMIADATDFFINVGAKPVKQHTYIGVDLMHNDIEIGSYGERTTDNLTWAYGTGIAEPRFSAALTT